MKASLLISCFNNKADLKQLLPSVENLRTAHHNLEVVLRDDGSTDGTLEWVNRHFKWIKILGGENLGFVRSNNTLFPEAGGDIVVLINADTLLHPDFLAAGLAVFEKFPDAVGVNSNMIMPWVMGLAEFLKTDAEALPAWEYQLTPYGYCQYIKVDKQLRKTSFMTGGGCFLKRSALNPGENIFDDSLGKSSYCEDTDLCLRLLSRGGAIYYAPKALIYHNQAPKQSAGRQALKKLFKITWNRFYVMAKHHSPGRFSRLYPMYLIGIGKKMNYLGLTGSKKNLAVLAGILLALPFALMFPYWLWISAKWKRRG